MNIDWWTVLLLLCVFQLGVLYGRYKERNRIEVQAQEDCDHEWLKVGYIDWQCCRCEKRTDGWPDQI